MKTCTTCHVAKDILCFGREASRPDGLCYRCLPCDAERARQWRAANPEKVREITIRRTGPRAAAKHERRLACKQQIPAWADRRELGLVWTFASAWTRATKKRHEVDHIVPLKSPRVVGLHVVDNLRIVPAVVNRLKGNRLWPHEVARPQAFA